jgi:hypothetical protein
LLFFLIPNGENQIDNFNLYMYLWNYTNDFFTSIYTKLILHNTYYKFQLCQLSVNWAIEKEYESVFYWPGRCVGCGSRLQPWCNHGPPAINLCTCLKGKMLNANQVNEAHLTKTKKAQDLHYNLRA